MDDTISRQAAIDEIHEDAEWLASQGSDWQVERMERDKSILMSLPSIQPETNCSEIPNNWIPCSERLPQEGEAVLTQAKFKDDMKMAVSSRIDYNYWTGWGTRNINIIAWMPLPEYYQEGEKE